MKAKQDFAKLLKDHNVSINTLLGKQLTSAATLGGAERSAEAREFGAKEATKRAGIVKPGEKERIMAKIADLRAKGKDEEADAMVQSYNSLSGSSAAVGGINAQRAILNAQLREVNRTLDPKNIDATDDEKAEAKAERDRILADLKALQAPGTQKPPKPTGGITPEEFNARWAQLAPGESLVGPDGKKYTKAPKNK
jgi:hypothetical protein